MRTSRARIGPSCGCRRRNLERTGVTPIQAFIGLGANLGEPARSLEAAVQRLAQLPATTLLKRSKFYRSAPVDSHGPDFVNAAVLLATTLAPLGLLSHLQDIEHAFGRERPFRNAPRTLDLDLLLYGQTVLDTPRLVLPHPRLHLRRFALAPLADLTPDLCIPGRGRLADLLAQVSGQHLVELDGEAPRIEADARRPSTQAPAQRSAP